MKFKTLFCLSLLLILGSCSSEESKIKDSLKKSIPIENRNLYQFKSYTIVASLLKSSIEDSISNLEISNRVLQMKIDGENQLKESYVSNLKDCEYQKRNTLPWLRSSYDSLIQDWQEMIDKSVAQIHADSCIIAKNDKEIQSFRTYIERADSAKSPVIFFKMHHTYTLNGAMKREDVLLDFEYQIVK